MPSSPARQPDARADGGAQHRLTSMLQFKPTARAVELLCNPVKPDVGTVTATMVTARVGAPRYDFCISLGAGELAYAFSAFLHPEGMGSKETHYTIRLQQFDETTPAGETFCSKLVCSDDGSRYTFCDDPSNFYSWPRELGAAIITNDNMAVLIPRVQPSGASAQFRVLSPLDSIITRFFAGQAREHLMMLSGPWAPKNGDEVALVHLKDEADSQLANDVVFRAHENGETLQVNFSAPLSPFQAFCIALALIHHAQHVRNAAQLASGGSMGEGMG
uniref:Tubby C-terminal domain-containing protein n=1 Tax=Haptolina ericina TaxID=156174 RepID=A0A7S3AX89_9EUKA